MPLAQLKATAARRRLKLLGTTVEDTRGVLLGVRACRSGNHHRGGYPPAFRTSGLDGAPGALAEAHRDELFCRALLGELAEQAHVSNTVLAKRAEALVCRCAPDGTTTRASGVMGWPGRLHVDVRTRASIIG
jgi:hypothetical protein